MIIGVPKETHPGERRVALVPGVLPALLKAGLEVLIEPGAGLEAGYPDDSYRDKKGKVAANRADLFRMADVILQVRGFGTNTEAGRADLELLKRDQILIGFQDPLVSTDAMKKLAGRGVTVFALELLPRITRAQVMDALSSMATVAGIAHGNSRSLVERAADVCLKERRKLILVPRETPLSLIHLRNLSAVAEAGAVVLPAAPGFYHKPTEIRQLVDFVVQRIVDQLGLEIEITKRWA